MIKAKLSFMNSFLITSITAPLNGICRLAISYPGLINIYAFGVLLVVPLKNLDLPTAMDFYKSLGWEYTV